MSYLRVKHTEVKTTKRDINVDSEELIRALHCKFIGVSRRIIDGRVEERKCVNYHDYQEDWVDRGEASPEQIRISKLLQDLEELLTLSGG